MTRPIQPEPSNWVISDHIIINGRHVTKGTELTITGVRGRFRFIRHVQVMCKTDYQCVLREWIDVVGGGTKKRPDMTRSFRPSQVKVVHRVNKTRANAS